MKKLVTALGVLAGVVLIAAPAYADTYTHTGSICQPVCTVGSAPPFITIPQGSKVVCNTAGFDVALTIMNGAGPETELQVLGTDGALIQTSPLGLHAVTTLHQEVSSYSVKAVFTISAKWGWDIEVQPLPNTSQPKTLRGTASDILVATIILAPCAQAPVPPVSTTVKPVPAPLTVKPASTTLVSAAPPTTPSFPKYYLGETEASSQLGGS